MYAVSYHHDIPQDLARIPKNILHVVQRAIEQRLLIDPVAYGLPLRKNLQGYRTLRAGDYRVVCRVDGHKVIILKIGRRRDVYLKILHRL